MRTQHLLQRRQGWYARLRIPAELQEVFDKKEFVETLKTRDISIARQRLPSKLADYQQRFNEARRTRVVASQYCEPVENITGVAKWLIEEQRTSDWNQELTPIEIFEIALEKVRNIELTSREERKLVSLFNHVENPQDRTLEETIEEHIKAKESLVRASTLEEKRKQLYGFAKWVGGETNLKSITKSQASEYVMEVIDKTKGRHGNPIAAKTKIKHISVLKAFFEWTEVRGLSQTNPFKGTELIIRNGKKAEELSTKVRGWNEGEVIAILEAAKLQSDNKLSAMILLGMYTGARGNEIAELKTSDATDWSLKIQGMVKNSNSVRNIPIHEAIKDLVSKLKVTSTDGYLVSGLKRGGGDNKRFHNIGKKFGRLKNTLGFKGRATVFHSYRHSFVSLLHRAEVPGEMISAAVGHLQDMNFTIHTYSDGIEDSKAIEVFNKADYGESVNKLVEELVETVRN